VLLLHSAQSGRVEREQVTGRHCHGCELIYRERWSEVMQILYGDN
jgi:hypothetical protein